MLFLCRSQSTDGHTTQLMSVSVTKFRQFKHFLNNKKHRTQRHEDFVESFIFHQVSASDTAIYSYNRGPGPVFVKHIGINSAGFDVWRDIKIKDKRELIRMKYRISTCPTIIIYLWYINETELDNCIALSTDAKKILLVLIWFYLLVLPIFLWGLEQKWMWLLIDIKQNMLWRHLCFDNISYLNPSNRW